MRYALTLLLLLILTSCASVQLPCNLIIRAESTAPNVVSYDVSIATEDKVHESGLIPIEYQFTTTGLNPGACSVSGEAYDADGESVTEYSYDLSLRGQTEKLTLRFR